MIDITGCLLMAEIPNKTPFPEVVTAMIDAAKKYEIFTDLKGAVWTDKYGEVEFTIHTKESILYVSVTRCKK